MATGGTRPPLGRALRDMRTFAVIWAGQLVSGLGSGLTAFALPVWIYERNHSAEQFGLLYFAATVPAVLLAPFAGALVDRWDRRRVLLASDAAAALMTAVIAALVFSGRFEVWHLFVLSLASASVGAFQDPAFSATVAAMVPREHLPRASGMMQTSASVIGLLTPLLAGVLVTVGGLGAVLVVDLATFLVAVGTLLVVRIPTPPRDPAAPRRHLLREAHDGWRWIRERPAMLYLLLYFPFVNLGTGMVNPLFPPLVLSFSTPAALGAAVTVSSLGMLVGGLALSAWGGPRRLLRGLLLCQAAGCVCVMLIGLRPSLPLVAAGLFLSLLVAPTAQACSQTIWLTKTPQEMLGRVLAIRRMLAMSSMPLAALAAGPLAERVFEPLMAPGGALQGTVGRVMGTGAGRGIGLMYVVIGLFVLAATAVLSLNPRVRRLEEEIPDAPLPVPPPDAEAEPEELAAAELGGTPAPA
ncbi:MAG TPA: MFS transporter [Longimicrobium sp.]|nr:MFS transporter [Longimicrobium sp.]